MYRPGHILVIPRPVILGNDHRRAGGHAGEKADDQAENMSGRAAHRRQGRLAHKAAYNDRVHRIIELLKQGTHQHREKEGQKLFPNDALGDGIIYLYRLAHDLLSPMGSIQNPAFILSLPAGKGNDQMQ